MLLKFRVSNFRSFGKMQEFSMVAGSPRLKLSHLASFGDLDVLKFSAVFGANAAGKSNLIRAIKFAQDVIINGLKESASNNYCRLSPIDGKEWKSKTSTFEFDIKIGEKYYTYGFDALLRMGMIEQEWLYEIINPSTGDEDLIFERKVKRWSYYYDSNSNFGSRKKEAEYELTSGERFNNKIAGILDLFNKATGKQSTSLYLSTMDYQKNNLSDSYPELNDLFSVNCWFNEELVILFPPDSAPKTDIYATPWRKHDNIDPGKLNFAFDIDDFKDIVRVMGLGINDVGILPLTKSDIPILFTRDEANKWSAYLPRKMFDEEVSSYRERRKRMYECRLEDTFHDLQKINPNIPEETSEWDAYFKNISEILKRDKTNLKVINGYRFMAEKTGIIYSIEEVLPDCGDEYSSIDDAEMRIKEDVRNNTQLLSRYKKYLEWKEMMDAVDTENCINKAENRRKTANTLSSTDLPENRAKLIRLKKGLILVTTKDGKPQLHKVIFNHGVENIAFSIQDESDGTQRMIDFIEILCAAKEQDTRTFIIDEIDRSLHPQLTERLVAQFLEYSSTKGETQLIVTTHESRIMNLSLLRRDEIWFVDKNAAGYSDLYSLEEFSERVDRKVDKAYFEGRYGGVPMFNVYFPKLETDSTPTKENQQNHKHTMSAMDDDIDDYDLYLSDEEDDEFLFNGENINAS